MAFSLANKLEVFYDVWVNIWEQVKEVAIDVEHLQALLNYWGNASCVINRVALDSSSQDCS